MEFSIPKMERSPKKHIPIAILIDCSESTHRIVDLLNRSIRTMIGKLQENVEISQQVEILAVLFSDYLQIRANFTPVCQIAYGQLDISSCEGTTNTGLALLDAIQRLRERKITYDGRQEKCSKPMIFLFTDGYPDPGDNAPQDYVQNVARNYADAAETIRMYEKDDQLYFYAAGIQRSKGTCADMDALRKLTVHPEHVFKVADDTFEKETVSRFCQMICEAAEAMHSHTPMQDVLAIMAE